MKRCPSCGETKNTDEFGKNRAKKDGLQVQCNSCRKISNADYYRRTPERNPQRLESRRKILESNQKFVVEYLESHPCVDCGNSDIRVLEFDHVRGVKNFNLSEGFRKSRSVIEAEIAKCDVRCANCHRIATISRLNNHYRLTYASVAEMD